LKRVEWLGDSLDRLRKFPAEPKREAGYQLERVQAGKEPADFKPMPSVGLGVNEIRIRKEGAFRVIYIAKFAEGIYVLHAFEKKLRKTSKQDIELARTRFRKLVQERKQQ
jgi:phage-related protein